MKNVIKLLSISLLVSGVVFSACTKPGDDPNNPDNWKDPNSKFYRAPVTGVTLSKDTLFLEIGATGALTEKLSPDNAYEKSVTWESSNEDVATVSNGTVTAKAVGKTKITVRTKDGNFTAVCNVEVVPTIRDYYGISVTTAFIKDGQVVPPTTTYTLSVPETGKGWEFQGLGLRCFITNTSDETIPKGTPYKFRMKTNGELVGFKAQDGSVVTVVEGKLPEDVLKNNTYSFFAMEKFTILPTWYDVGDNNICSEVLQVGVKDYAAPQTGCLNYKIDIKESSKGIPSFTIK